MPVAGIETYHRPTDVAEAWDLVRDGGSSVRLLAGGTDLTVSPPPGLTTLVDLQAAGLRSIDVDEDGAIHIGAMTTFTDLLEHPDVPRYAGGALHEMLAQLGSVLHRNLGTLGGHLARARMSDVVPVLLALGAEVSVLCDEPVDRPLADHLADPPNPHVLTAVHLPAPDPDAAAAFDRITRAAFDHSLVNACTWVQLTADTGATVAERVVADARIVVGQTGRLGHRVPEAEEALRGGPLDDEHLAAARAAAQEAVDGRADAIASGPFREHLAGVLVERCLGRTRDRLGGGTA
jgi:CO/xanthine dehydrogenase FAD-binding subunit